MDHGLNDGMLRQIGARRCRVCGLTYIPGDESAEHARRHRQALLVVRPKPLARFLRRLEEVTDPEHVLSWDPECWLHRQLFLRARMFQREFGYDFPQWSELGGDEDPSAHGFLFNDDTGAFGYGAIAGGCAFRWREWKNAPVGWSLDWVWIAPSARRKGLLTRRWPDFEKRFGHFRLERPLSPAMNQFANKHHWVD